MSKPRPEPDAREVVRIEALVTANDPARADTFLTRCLPGTTWRVRIRTADVSATVRDRRPLGTFDERDCTCLSLRLALPVPVEPGLRFQIYDAGDETLSASGLIRPWDD
jgi:translation elongation factor EF-Tu-like GTPase